MRMMQINIVRTVIVGYNYPINAKTGWQNKVNTMTQTTDNVKLTAKQISDLAKSEPTPAAQKRKINALFRAQDSKQGLPDFNNEFSVTDRAIKSLGRYMGEQKIEFNCFGYANALEIEIRAVVQRAWTNPTR